LGRAWRSCDYIYFGTLTVTAFDALLWASSIISITAVASSHLTASSAPSRMAAPRLRYSSAYDPASEEHHLQGSLVISFSQFYTIQHSRGFRDCNFIGFHLLDSPPQILWFPAILVLEDCTWRRYDSELVFLYINAKLRVRSLRPPYYVSQLRRANRKCMRTEDDRHWVPFGWSRIIMHIDGKLQSVVLLYG